MRGLIRGIKKTKKKIFLKNLKKFCCFNANSLLKKPKNMILKISSK